MLITLTTDPHLISSTYIGDSQIQGDPLASEGTQVYMCEHRHHKSCLKKIIHTDSDVSATLGISDLVILCYSNTRNLKVNLNIYIA